jgi:hypothetical protein
VDPELAHSAAQRARFQSQGFRCAVPAFDASSRQKQDAPNVCALDVDERVADGLIEH